MSIGMSSAIVTKGLALHVDFGNVKGYAGPAVKNFATEITPRGTGDNGSTYRFFSMPNETVYIPEIGTVANCPTMDMYNDYNGGSGNCCPSPYTYGNNITVSPSTQYTYAIVYRSFNRYTNPNWMYHYEYTSGGSYLTEYGVHSVGGYGASEVHLGNGWYWSRAIFTTNASAGFINTGSWMYQYATWNRFQVAKILIAPGDLRSLHPRYWPEVNTTRSASASCYDLTGNHTVDMSNVSSYNSDGSVNFNSSNYVRIPNNTILDNQEVTVECWVKTNATNQNGFWFEKGTVNTQYSLFQEGANIVWRQAGSSQYTTTSSYMNTGSWYQVVGTYRSGERKTYINGTLVTSDSATGALNTNTGGSSIGVYGGYSGGRGYYYNGNLMICRVYSTVLSQDEIKQNFNANRGRFGI